MAVLVYVDNSGGKFTKSACEAVYYGSQVAKQQGTETVAMVIGQMEENVLAGLGGYGANKVLHVTDPLLDNFDSTACTKVVVSVVETVNPDVIVFCHNFNSKAIAPRLSVILNAGLIVGVVDVPNTDGGGFSVKRSVYSGKAFGYFGITSEKKILALQSNSFDPENNGSAATVEKFSVQLSEDDVGVRVDEVSRATDKIPLSEASIIISGGRGLKGSENFAMLEEMADLLGGAVACSKPVADMEWRPHTEHVGQTGLTVRPDLYLAIGISGAIQHLAGVNGSKYIVAINKDPEAPIFNAADYGIVGDAFDVVPKLIEAIKQLKGKNT